MKHDWDELPYLVGDEPFPVKTYVATDVPPKLSWILHTIRMQDVVSFKGVDCHQLALALVSLHSSQVHKRSKIWSPNFYNWNFDTPHKQQLTWNSALKADPYISIFLGTHPRNTQLHKVRVSISKVSMQLPLNANNVFKRSRHSRFQLSNVKPTSSEHWISLHGVKSKYIQDERWNGRKRPYVPPRPPVDSVLMGLNGNSQTATWS